MSGRGYSYSYGRRDIGSSGGGGRKEDEGGGGLGFGSIAGETGVEMEGRVSAGEVEVSMSMGRRVMSMSRVSGLDWRRAGS